MITQAQVDRATLRDLTMAIYTAAYRVEVASRRGGKPRVQAFWRRYLAALVEAHRRRFLPCEPCNNLPDSTAGERGDRCEK